MAGLLSKGIKLSYKEATETSFTVLPNLMSIPEIGGTPEKIEVTTLDDAVKKYINGLKDYGDLEYKFLYDADEDNSAFKTLKGLEGNDEVIYQLTFPDGTSFEFTADVSVRTDSAETNAALTFTASFALQSDVTYTANN